MPGQRAGGQSNTVTGSEEPDCAESADHLEADNFKQGPATHQVATGLARAIQWTRNGEIPVNHAVPGWRAKLTAISVTGGPCC